MTLLRSSVIAGVLLIPAASAIAAEPGSCAALGPLQAWLDGTRDLEARFTQRLVSGALGAGATESGRVWIGRPGRMRWEYTRPERKVALVTGNRTRLYLEADRQLWEGHLGDVSSLLPELLAGTRPLGELFECAALPDPEPDDGVRRVKIRPRGTEATFEEAELGIRGDGAIVSVEVLDHSGNRMHYALSSLRRNRGLPADLFELVPPPGTEIIRG